VKRTGGGFVDGGRVRYQLDPTRIRLARLPIEQDHVVPQTPPSLSALSFDGMRVIVFAITGWVSAPCCFKFFLHDSE
jgi:hypothetical protein